jgi:DNA-binding HxlR family transcriptional regulator
MKVKSDDPEKPTLKGEAKPEASIKEKEVISAGKSAQVLVQEEPISAADFHNNDSKILSLLNEAGSNYSFKGLMRKLSLHQQSLSRALHRLEEMGLVEKSPVGYRLSKTGESTVSKLDAVRPKGREYMQLLQTYIPLNVRASEVVRQLVGRWFKNLRWLGMIESGTGYTLQWSSDDGSFQINLRMISDYIIIETNASTEKEKVEAMVGSYAIYEQITKAMQSRLGAYADRSLTFSNYSN